MRRSFGILNHHLSAILGRTAVWRGNRPRVSAEVNVDVELGHEHKFQGYFSFDP